MKPRHTKEIFVARSQEKFGDKYDYSKVIYVNAKTEVTLICKEHQEEFNTQPYVHLNKSKHGCTICRLLYGGKNTPKRTTAEAIYEFMLVHGDKYDYSKFKYTLTNKNSIVTCKEHGDFNVAPTNHLRGTGCAKCGTLSQIAKQSLTQDEYIERAKSVHKKSNYDYSQTEYLNNRGKIIIKCRSHGVFKQRASKHLEGSGCPTCAKTGFSTAKNATLYIIEADNITKVGITNLPVKSRITALSREYGSEYRIVETYDFDSGQHCTDIETDILRELRLNYKNPDRWYEGYTESFYDVDQSKLLARIEELIKEYDEKETENLRPVQ